MRERGGGESREIEKGEKERKERENEREKGERFINNIEWTVTN